MRWLSERLHRHGKMAREQRGARNHRAERRVNRLLHARPLRLECLEHRTLLSVTVSTDKLDYAAGEMGTITATGFTPGETIELQLLHGEDAANTETGSDPCRITDGAQGDLDGAVDGNIKASWLVDEDATAGSTFQVTATGLTSGAVAVAEFTCTAVPALSVAVLTDKPDYSPGETATVTATGFTPGETLQLQVLHIDDTPNAGSGHDPWQVTDGADGDLDGLADGNVQTTWLVAEDDSSGSVFEVTATGLLSGDITRGQFTDSQMVTLLYEPVNYGKLVSSNWSYVDVETDYDHFPAGPIGGWSYAIEFDGDDECLVSRSFDLTNYTDPTLSYYVERQGWENPPEYNDHLHVEYRNSTGNWIDLQEETIYNTATAYFTYRSIPIPLDAIHTNFAFRFNAYDSDVEGDWWWRRPADDWFVDNVRLRATLDTTAPAVTARTPVPGSTIATESVNIDVSFSEAVVGIDATDLVLSGTAAGAASVGNPVPQGGNTWRFQVAGLADGMLQVYLAPDANDIEDLAGNDLAPVVWSYTVGIPPTVTHCDPQPGSVISSSSVDMDVTFSEEVHGVDATDLVFSGTAADAASVGPPTDRGGNTWRFPVSGLNTGTLHVSLAPDADDIEDLAGNDLDPSPKWAYTVDLLAPPVLDDEPPFTAGTTNTVSWSASEGADRYYVEMDEDPGFGSPDRSSGWIGYVSHEFSGLVDATTYHYRAKARQTVPGTSDSWSQTAQSEFSGDVLDDVTTTAVPGDVLLAQAAGDSEITGRISNPSFEAGGTSGWTLAYSGPPPSAVGPWTMGDGSHVMFIRTSWREPNSPGDYVRLSQEVDLTAIDTITFDVYNMNPSYVAADVLIDEVTLFSHRSFGTLNDRAIDVSDLDGIHTLTIQETVREAHDGFEASIYFDDFRTYTCSGYAASGSVVTAPICPEWLDDWGIVTFNDTTPPGTSLVLDVLPPTGSTPIPGYGGVSSGTDLSGIAHAAIRLRATLATTDPLSTPALHDWEVTWQDTPDTLVESGWSNVESSTQDDTPPTVALAAPEVADVPTPTVTVTATDASGLPEGTAVVLDVDLNNDGDFDDPGELGYTTSSLVGGTTTFDVSPALEDGEYPLRARVCDLAGNEGLDSRIIIVQTNQPPEANAGGGETGYVGFEGSPITFDASGSSDPDGDPLQYRWDFDSDGTWDTVFSDDPTATYTWGDDWAGTATVEVSDGQLTDTANASVTVSNVAPTVGPITAPLDPVAGNTEISVDDMGTDPGSDDLTFTWNWGDGTSDTVTIYYNDGVAPDPYPSPDINARTVTDSVTHTYTAAGVYTVTVTVTDDDGDSDESVFQYVVVYDPNAGFVTGGGWIVSPEGAYAPDQSLTGKANFGFVSKYKNGATTPTGQTEFQFRVADLDFHSSEYQWLVIAGANAKYKGSGTINGDGNYGFMLTATDAQINGGAGTDRFRIKIWDKDLDGAALYDNQPTELDGSYAGTELGGGSIVIHNGGSALHAAEIASRTTIGATLSQDTLDPVLQRAVSYWEGQGIGTDRLTTLSQIGVHVADLAAPVLAIASSSNLIWIDRDAAGRGWSDPAGTLGLDARAMDLLSVVTHEFGHKLGLDHHAPYQVMAPTLAPGVRTVATSASLQGSLPAARHVYALSLDPSPSILAKAFSLTRDTLSLDALDTRWTPAGNSQAARVRDQFFDALAMVAAHPVLLESPPKGISNDESEAETGRLAELLALAIDDWDSLGELEATPEEEAVAPAIALAPEAL